jgi:hypothetical protein
MYNYVTCVHSKVLIRGKILWIETRESTKVNATLEARKHGPYTHLKI